jgi:hypothetical protein
MKPTLNARAFGPNGEAVAKLIERASSLTAEEAEQLSVAWNDSEHVFWEDASVRNSWDDVWNVHVDAAWDAAWHAAWHVKRSSRRGSTWEGVWCATWSAVLALVARDRFSEDYFNTLYGPWASVMEAS